MLWQRMLVPPEEFSGPAFAEIPNNGISHPPGSDDAKSPNRRGLFVKLWNI